MPTTNYDASVLTQRRQAKALQAQNAAREAAQQAGQTVRVEQPTAAVLSVVTARKQGGCFCATDASTNPYPFAGGCGC